MINYISLVMLYINKMVKIIIRNNFGDLYNEFLKFEYNELQILFKKNILK